VTIGVGRQPILRAYRAVRNIDEFIDLGTDSQQGRDTMNVNDIRQNQQRMDRLIRGAEMDRIARMVTASSDGASLGARLLRPLGHSQFHLGSALVEASDRQVEVTESEQIDARAS
jgi:hypothetical protein